MKDIGMFLLTVTAISPENKLHPARIIDGIYLVRDEDAKTEQEAAVYFQDCEQVNDLENYHLSFEVVDWSDPRTATANDLIPF